MSAPHSDAAEFLEELARALHIYGLPSHRLEEALNEMARSLEVDSQFLVTPTSVVFSIGTDTHLMRINQGATHHLERLADLDRIMRDVRRGELEASAGTTAIRELATRPPRYSRPVTVGAFCVASGTAALFFGGGWREMVGAALIGTLIGTIALLSDSSVRLARLLPAVGGFLAATVAHGLAQVLDPMFAFLSTLAGLILLIPGLTLTVAMNELAHHHLVSGTARLTGACITFLQLGFGTALGWKLSAAVAAPTSVSTPVPLPGWLEWVALPLTVMAFVVLFRAHPRDYFSILLGCAAAYGASRWGSSELGPEVGMAFGAWSLGCISTLLARALRRPVAIALVPGLLLLVPGTLGIRSLQALVRKDVPLGVESAFTMTILAIALVTGLFLANLTLRPRQL